MSQRLQKAQESASNILGLVQGEFTPKAICDHGEGIYLYDHDGRRYIDFSGGPHVVTIGHGNRQVKEALLRQVEKVSYFFRGFWLSEPLLALAERVLAVAPSNFAQCWFCGSGSEATESALKLARQYHAEGGKPDKYLAISRWQSYHGMTLGALSASGHTLRRLKYGPLLHQWPKIVAPHCYRCPYELAYPGCDIRCAWALEEMINQIGARYVAAFFAEPVGGAGTAAGVPVPEYYPIIREICDRHDVLFVDDEVICGFGRTGRWFGIEHWGVSPDIITSAKGMTGGYVPMAVLIVDQKIAEVFRRDGVSFVHDFTMAGNPVSAAACLAVLDVIEKENLVARCAGLEKHFFQRGREKLAHHPSVGDIRGKGLLMGIELVKDRDTKEPFELKLRAANRLQRMAQEHGVLGYPTSGVANGATGDALLLSPPLNVTGEETLGKGCLKTPVSQIRILPVCFGWRGITPFVFAQGAGPDAVNDHRRWHLTAPRIFWAPNIHEIAP
jgi:adenosylmethionine-8-amino-7-oxononanoate aminotransferase